MAARDQRAQLGIVRRVARRDALARRAPLDVAQRALLAVAPLARDQRALLDLAPRARDQRAQLDLAPRDHLERARRVRARQQRDRQLQRDRRAVHAALELARRVARALLHRVAHVRPRRVARALLLRRSGLARLGGRGDQRARVRR